MTPNYDLWKITDPSRDAADSLYEDAMEWAADRPELSGTPDRYVITAYLDFLEQRVAEEADARGKESRERGDL